MSHYIRSFFCVSEMCMTSNIVCGTSKSYREHHIQEWIKNDLPFTLCVRSYISLYVQLQLENRISHFQDFFSIFYCNYIFVRSCNQNSHFPPPHHILPFFVKFSKGHSCMKELFSIFYMLPYNPIFICFGVFY